jgi:hypothetical protein
MVAEASLGVIGKQLECGFLFPKASEEIRQCWQDEIVALTALLLYLAHLLGLASGNYKPHSAKTRPLHQRKRGLVSI